MKYFVLGSMLFPYRSLVYDFVGIKIPNYYFLIPFLLLMVAKKGFFIDKKNMNVLFFSGGMILFFLVKAFFVGVEYFGLTETNLIFSFVFLFLFAEFCLRHTKEFVWVVKKLIVVNIFYAVLQNVLMVFDFSQLTMWHSNLALQENYTIPVFIYPFFRVNGFFNESSQLVIFLILSIVFLHYYENSQKGYMKYLVSFFSFSKTGFMYILVFLVARYKILAIIFLSLLSVPAYQLYLDPPPWLRWSLYALELRLQGLLSVFSNGQNVIFGESLSSGQLALDFVGIYLNGMGVAGLSILATYFIYIVWMSKKYVFFPILAVSLLANGALPSMQYLLFYVYAILLYRRFNQNNVYLQANCLKVG